MTVETTVSRVSHNTDGINATYPVPFYFLDDTHLKVILVVPGSAEDGTLTLTADYTVTGAGDPDGGNVILNTVPASGGRVIIIIDPPITQLSAYQSNARFPAASHERALDKGTMIDQRTRDLVSRSLRLPDYDVDGSSGYDAGGKRITNAGHGVDNDDLVTTKQLAEYAAGDPNAFGATMVRRYPRIDDGASAALPAGIVMTEGALSAADGGGAAWVYDPTDRSVEVANDPRGVMFKGAPNASGAQGAWVRQYGDKIDISAFRTAPGEVAAAAITDAAAFEAAMKADGKQLIAAPAFFDLTRNLVDVVCPANSALGQARAAAAHAHALVAGKRVRLGSGVWTVTGCLTPATGMVGAIAGRVRVEGVGDGLTEVIQATPVGISMWYRRGTVVATASSPKLASSVQRGVSTIPIDSGGVGMGTLQVGDWVRLQDPGQIVYDNGSGVAVCHTGQVGRILAISGWNITLYGATEFDYTDQTKVRKINDGGGIWAENLLIRPDVEPTQPIDPLLDPDERTPFQVLQGVGSHFAGLKIYHSWQNGISLSGAIDAEVLDSRGTDMGSKTTSGSYFLVLGGGCSDIRMHNVHCRNVRHTITSVVSNVDSVEIAHVSVSDSSATECRLAGFDQHPGARHWTFDNCQIYAGRMDTVFTPVGINLRGRFSEATNCTVVGCDRGFYIVFGERNRVVGGQAQGCRIGVDVNLSPYSSVIGTAIRYPIEKGLNVQGVMDGFIARDLDVEGNPSVAAFSFTNFNSTWDIDYGRTLKSPQATTRFSGLPAWATCVVGEWTVVAEGWPNTNTGGLTTEVILQDTTLAGSSLGATGEVRITAMWSCPSSANTKTFLGYWDGVAIFNATATARTGLELTTTVRNSAVAAQSFKRLAGADGNTPSVVNTTANTATDRLIRLSGTAANAGENITLVYYKIEVRRKP